MARRINAFTDSYIRRCTASAWKGTKGRCRWCNEPYGARRRRWCSDKCADAYQRNHWWWETKKAARRRDKYTCQICGLRKRDGARLEVHHLNAILGKHSESGCHHHLDGVVTLCHECHVKTTNIQFGRGQ